MKAWTIDEAKIHFPELIASSANEPQVILRNQEAVSVMLDIRFFQQLIEKWQERPSIKGLLKELADIRQAETEEIELFERTDRSEIDW